MTDWLPKHKGALYLQHNEHKNLYENVEQWIVDNLDGNEWVSEEERQKAIQTDSVWTLQWYPDTPVGFHIIAASTVEAIRDAVLEELDR